MKSRFPALKTNPDATIHAVVADQLYIVPQFLQESTCIQLCKLMDTTFPMESTPPAKRGEAQRTNLRYSVHDPAFATHLWKGTPLHTLFHGAISSDAVDCNANIRLYRYLQGQYFGQHYDDSIVDEHGRTSHWTLLVYLTGHDTGVVGGETVFYHTKRRKGSNVLASIRPEQGMLLLHRHGHECLLHEGAVVKKGNKYVLRSDVLFP